MTMFQYYKRSRHFVFSAFIAFVFVLLCQNTAFARASSNGDLPTKADLQAQLDSLNKQKDLSAQDKLVQQDLTDTLATLDKIDRVKEETVQLRQKVAEAPEKMRQATAALTALSDVDNDEETRKILSTLSLRQLETRVAQALDDLQNAQNDLASYNSQLVSLQTQPERVQNAMYNASQQLQQIRSRLDGTDVGETALRPSQKVLMQAQQALLNAEIDQQRKSLEGNTVLQDTLQKQRDYVTANSARLEHQLQLLQEAVNSKRLTLTEKTAQEAVSPDEAARIQANPLVKQELEIKKSEILEALHFASLEKIFIEERIYKDKEFEQSKDMDAACEHIDKRLTPYYPQFIREVTKEDILKLMEIKMGRILKFNSDKADELIAKMKEEIAEIDNHLAHIVDYTVNWYQMLKNKYGKNFPRRTELRNFDTIEAAKVVEANEKLYINREEGFIGTSLKKDEFVACCSDIDDVIIFFRDGKYIVTPVADKKFVGKNVLYVNVFKKNDKRTIYNVAYRDGKEGTTYVKRFAVTSVVRDREYDVTQGTPDSRITYFSANPNGEAEIIKVTLKPNPRVRRIIFEQDFSEVGIKGRQARGIILTRLPVHKIALKQKGGSTLGGRKVWFDRDILRLNYDGRGEYLGEFQSEDTILVVLNNGDFYTSNFDLSNHYEDNVSIVEKFDPNKVWTAALYDADQQNYPYLKRFCFEGSNRKQNYLGENKNNRLILLTDEYYPRLEVIFGGHDSFRDPLEIEAEEFIAVKGFKAKGKRITTYAVETINELEPTRFPEPVQESQEEPEEEPENLDPDSDKSEGDIIDEITGQMKLF